MTHKSNSHTISQKNLKELRPRIKNLCLSRVQFISYCRKYPSVKDFLCRWAKRLPKWKAMSVCWHFISRVTKVCFSLREKRAPAEIVGVIISLLSSLHPWWKWKDLQDNLERTRLPQHVFTCAVHWVKRLPVINAH